MFIIKIFLKIYYSVVFSILLSIINYELYSYNFMKRPNLYDYLKILAIITMIIDHIWFLFFPEQIIWRIIWRTAFPLFLFLVWYNHSYRRKPSLWIWWITLQIALRIWWMYWLTDIWYINILLAIWVTRVLLEFLQKHNSYRVEILIFIVCLWLLRFTYEYIDYGTLSIVFALLWYWVRKYGNWLYINILIAFCVWYHLLFMILTRSFGDYTILLGAVWVLLFCSMYLMSKRNYSLMSSHQIYNRSIIALSTYALEIYMLQIIVLGILFMIK